MLKKESIAMNRILSCDPEFQRLIPPLSADERKRLEDDIVEHGCLDPVIVWNDIILDGHNRYEICNRRQIPYQVKSLSFDSRDRAISWICTHSIGRRNLSEENRRYILGKLYEVQKRINVRNPFGFNQYKGASPDAQPLYESKYGLAQDIGDKFHIAHSTVEKYGQYARAVDKIADVCPEVAARCLTGEVHIGLSNTIELARMKEHEIKAIAQTVQGEGEHFLPKDEMVAALIRAQDSFPSEDEDETPPQPSVKDMPVFDPDADVASLTLTIPMWQSSITRVKDAADMSLVSDQAKSALKGAFASLIGTINLLLNTMQEEQRNV